MKKFLKDLGVVLLMTTMIFSIMYMLILTADAEYEIQQEKERAYFDRAEEMRR